jgi:hypothetical protein
MRRGISREILLPNVFAILGLAPDDLQQRQFFNHPYQY